MKRPAVTQNGCVDALREVKQKRCESSIPILMQDYRVDPREWYFFSQGEFITSITGSCEWSGLNTIESSQDSLSFEIKYFLRYQVLGLLRHFLLLNFYSKFLFL